MYSFLVRNLFMIFILIFLNNSFLSFDYINYKAIINLVPAPIEDECICGPNTDCRNGICHCKPEYFGDPNIGCRPECVLNTDCSSNRACIRNKCTDPCPNTCGQGAECYVAQHTAMCTCPTGTDGNAFISCKPIAGNLMSTIVEVTVKLFLY